MKGYKKLLIVLIALNMFFLSMVVGVQNASASIYAKPLMTAGKKALKEVAKDSAVSMAEQIVFEKLMSDMLNSDLVDDGYAPVCLDSRSSPDNCPDNKKAQIKDTLTQSDRSSISSKLESIIEQKTGTDTRVGKFLDFFVPIFLIGGIVSFVSAQLDTESQGLLNDMSMQALTELDIIKPLNVGTLELLDFSSHIQSARAYTQEVPISWSSQGTPKVVLEFVPKQSIVMEYDLSPGTAKTGSINFSPGLTYRIGVTYLFGSTGSGDNRNGTLYVTGFNSDLDVYTGNTVRLENFFKIDNTFTGTSEDVMEYLRGLFAAHSNGFINNSSVNNTMNSFLGQAGLHGIRLNVRGVTAQEQTPVPLDLSGLRPINYSTYYINNQLPAQESIPIRTPEGTRVYPTPSGQEWTTSDGRPIDVDPDTLIVEDVNTNTTPEVPPDEGEGENLQACTRNLKNIDFKRVGVAFTSAFPFSIPWDIKRFIDNAFGGVGSEKPSVNLSFLGDGVTLTIPSYFDSWLPFVKGLIVIVFDIGLLYLFYRFMKGGGD